MDINTQKCDICLSSRKDGEHGWFRAYTDATIGVVIITHWDVELSCEELHFIPDQPQKHLCSESCAVKLMSQTIGSGTASTSTDEGSNG